MTDKKPLPNTVMQQRQRESDLALLAQVFAQSRSTLKNHHAHMVAKIASAESELERMRDELAELAGRICEIDSLEKRVDVQPVDAAGKAQAREMTKAVESVKAEI